MNTTPWPLKQKTIVGHADGPHVVITGGVHGDEFEPMVTARRLISELNPSELRGRVTLVPVVNEPAFTRGRRTAEDEKDLARTCPGHNDGTVTERIAASLSRLIRTADFYIDLHTAGTVFQMLPLAGYVLHTNPQILERQRQMAQAFGFPVVWGTNGRLDGRSLSVARDANVPAIYIENGGGGTCDAARVEQNVEGCRAVMRVLGMLAGPEPASNVRYFVEDDRDRSGHLQVQSQASVAGYFEPSVSLGDVVERGEPIGQILDPLGERSVTVTAYDNGTVLFLRSFPSVQPGDPLVAILPTTAPGEVRYPRES
jgi:predicted deacylase